MPLILFFAIFISTFYVQAEIEISDPKKILTSLPFRDGRESFADALKCMSTYNFFVKRGHCRIHCEFSICEETCRAQDWADVQFQIEECSTDLVSAYSNSDRSLSILKRDFEQASNTVALAVIKSIPLFYDNIEKIEIESTLHGARKNLIDQGQMRSVILTLIFFSIYPDRSKDEKTTMAVSLDLSRSGLDQLMCLSPQGLCHKNQDFLFKRKGLVNAPH